MQFLASFSFADYLPPFVLEHAIVLGLLFFGFIVTLLTYITGAGAGVLLVPALIAIFHEPAASAVGTASLVAVGLRFGASVSHARQGNLHWPSLKRFTLIALPASVLCSLVMGFLPQVFPQTKAGVDNAIRILVLFASLLALVSLYSQQLKAKLKKIGINGLAVGSGMLIGATGVGGGVLVVPALLSLGTLNASQSIGTSTVIGLILSLATGLSFALSSPINMMHLLWMLAGGVLALPYASRLASMFSQKTLVDIVAALIVVSINALVMRWLS